MTTAEQKDLTFINLHYGVEVQGRQAMEECAELIQAVSKVLRRFDQRHNFDPSKNDDVFNNLKEELADVGIVIDELTLLFGIPKQELEDVRERKICRTLTRITEEFEL